MARDIVDLTGDVADRLINRADTLLVELADVVKNLAALLPARDTTEEPHGS